MSNSESNFIWSEDDLWSKGKLYIRRALDADRNGALYPFWMTLALEFIARAALSKVHPVLNADLRSEKNVYFGLGLDTSGTPKTIPIHAVFGRCVEFVEGFETSHKAFCDFLGLQRNAEVHTGGLPFENLRLQEWVEKYYDIVEILCRHLGHDLEELLGCQEARAARELLQASAAGLESSVRSAIAAHKKVFHDKPKTERTLLRDQARIRTYAKAGLSAAVDCPACSSSNLVKGRAIRTSMPYYDEGTLLEDTICQSESYSCHACGLGLPTLSHIQWSGIEPQFTVVTETDLHQHQEFDYYEYEYMNE